MKAKALPRNNNNTNVFNILDSTSFREIHMIMLSWIFPIPNTLAVRSPVGFVDVPYTESIHEGTRRNPSPNRNNKIEWIVINVRSFMLYSPRCCLMKTVKRFSQRIISIWRQNLLITVSFDNSYYPNLIIYRRVKRGSIAPGVRRRYGTFDKPNYPLLSLPQQPSGCITRHAVRPAAQQRSRVGGYQLAGGGDQLLQGHRLDERIANLRRLRERVDQRFYGVKPIRAKRDILQRHDHLAHQSPAGKHFPAGHALPQVDAGIRGVVYPIQQYPAAGVI